MPASSQKTQSAPSTRQQCSLDEAAGRAKEALQKLTGWKPDSVVGVKKEGDEWVVSVEMLEKEGIPDRMDLLGIYEARLNPHGELLRYEKTGSRKRGDTTGSGETE